MKHLTLAIILVGAQFLSGQLFGQGFLGQVEDDTAYIIFPSAPFSDWAHPAGKWQISVEVLKAANPGLVPGNWGGIRDIRIPLAPLLQTQTCVGCQPVFHIVRQSEGLFRIGQWYGKTKTAILKEMNGLRSEALKPGQRLLVGYIQVPKVDEQKMPEKAMVHTEDSNRLVGMGGFSTDDSVALSGERAAPDFLEKNSENELIYEGNGFFEGEWAPATNGITRKTIKAASFKSESGWIDGRFYLLHSLLKPGLVVKITRPGTNTVIYAKVVGPLPDLKQNAGLQMRMNSAAAVKLGIWDEQQAFEVVLEY